MRNCLGEITRSIRVGDLAVFCGAGISKNSGLPLANELKQYILRELAVDKEDVQEIMSSNHPLEAFLETVSGFMDISRILEIFDNGEPNTNHVLIARLAKNGYLKTIFTTNFDLLIEKALEKEGLIRNIDFEVYCDEEQFSGTCLENTDSKMVRVFKIHGSIDDRDSIKTTMKAIATKSLYSKRIEAIRYLFLTGDHKKVLILGYSCSDEFDITPQIRGLDESKKETFFVEHREGGEKEDVLIEAIETKDFKNPFTRFAGKRIECNTDDFIRGLWNSLKNVIGEYEPAESEVGWMAYLDDWAKLLKGKSCECLIAAETLYKISNYNRAIEYLKKGLERAKTTRDVAGVAASYTGLGNAYHSLGDFKKAIQCHETSLEIAKVVESKVGEAQCCIGLGNAYSGLEDFKGAIKYYGKALEVAIARGASAEEAICHTNLGLSYCGLGNFKRAVEHLQKGLERAKATGDKELEMHCYVGLGNVYSSLGDFEGAIANYEKALEVTKAIGDKTGEAICYVNSGIAYISLKAFKAAIEYLFKAEGIIKEIQQIDFLKYVYENLTLAYGKIGDNENRRKYEQLAKPWGNKAYLAGGLATIRKTF